MPPAPGLLCLGVVVGALACGAPTFPESPPALVGEIVGIGPDVPFGSARAAWVKEDPDDPCGIVFRVTDETEIGIRLADGSIALRPFEALARGQRVHVWSGPIAESCPGQGRADAVQILP